MDAAAEPRSHGRKQMVWIASFPSFGTFPAVLQIGAGKVSRRRWKSFREGTAHPSYRLVEAVLGIQDNVASTFKKFHDLLRLISLDAHFTQRFAKVRKKPVEMPVV